MVPAKPPGRPGDNPSQPYFYPPMPATRPDPDTAPRRTPWLQAWVAEAVERIEADGPLHDEAELRQAFRSQPTRQAQFLERAWLLGQRLGLPRELARWRHVGGWVVLALALAMVLSGWAVARTVLGQGRDINAIAAFVATLGLHGLTLLLWGLGLLWSLRGRADGGGGLSLGRLALWLTARLPLERGPHSLTLLHAGAALLRRQRLLPWVLGAVSHGVWTLAFVLILAMLAFGFAFHAYQLTWETTILSSTFFERFVQLSGWLPGQLGFPVPDAASVRQAAAASGGAGPDAGQRAWAWWLIGSVAVYGLLPRLLLGVFSAWRWRAGRARLAELDKTDPYVRRIVARLDALEPPPQVIDAEQRPAPLAAPPRPAGPPGAPGSLAVIGFELPPEAPWPPAGLPAERLAGAHPLARIAGSAAERQAVLAELAAARPESLLLVCHGPASPDRGTARFVREATRLAGRGALWPQAGDARANARWRAWLDSEHFEALAGVETATGAIKWIANSQESAA